MQMMRNTIDEFGRKSAHDIEDVRTRTNEIMQSAEALLVVGSLTIGQVHQHLANPDQTIAHMSFTLGSRAEKSDRHLHELAARFADRGHGSPQSGVTASQFGATASQAAGISRPQTLTLSKRRMGHAASPNSASSPGPKR